MQFCSLQSFTLMICSIFILLRCTALHCTILYIIALIKLNCSVLKHGKQHYLALYHSVPHTPRHFTALHSSLLNHTAVHYYCTALHCTALQYTSLFSTTLHNTRHPCIPVYPSMWLYFTLSVIHNKRGKEERGVVLWNFTAIDTYKKTKKKKNTLYLKLADWKSTGKFPVEYLKLTGKVLKLYRCRWKSTGKLVKNKESTQTLQNAKQMAPHGSKWLHMTSNGSKWLQK